MRQFTHPTLSLLSPSKLRASTSVKRTTAVCTPPKRLYSLHWTPRSGLPSTMHSATTNFCLVTVWSRSLTSRVLFETKDSTSAFYPTARFSAFSKAETSLSFLRTRRIFSLLVLWMKRTSTPEFGQLKNYFVVKFKLNKCLKFQRKLSFSIMFIFVCKLTASIRE